MTVSTSELTVTYNSVTFGGSGARQITDYTIEEMDFHTGAFEFEFITTAATDAAFATELNTVRETFRTPRQDLVVTQNASTILSRKQSNNTGLDTFPTIIKDGDPADTGRSRHFRVRVEYELPADVTSTSFRRGATVSVAYSLERRRTVTITGIYTANSTDGTTTADAQYFAQIAAAETTLLNTVDSSVTWERVGQPQVEYFETQKTCQFTRVYKEVNIPQALGTTDDADIIDPHLDIAVQQIAPGDSIDAPLTFGGGGSGSTVSGIGPGSGGHPTVVAGPPMQGGSGSGALPVRRPVQITVRYDAGINFSTVSNQALQTKWTTTIRPWIIDRTKAFKVAGTLAVISETPAYEIYENHIAAEMSFIAYFDVQIIEQRVTYSESLSDGYSLHATTSKDPFSFYEYPGPSMRIATVVEERKEILPGLMSSYGYYVRLAGESGGPGAFANILGQKWRRLSREPEGMAVTQGLSGGAPVVIGTAKIVSLFQFRNVKPPSTENAGGVTGVTLT